jgi:hypothetical protein
MSSRNGSTTLCRWRTPDCVKANLARRSSPRRRAKYDFQSSDCSARRNPMAGPGDDGRPGSGRSVVDGLRAHQVLPSPLGRAGSASTSLTASATSRRLNRQSRRAGSVRPGPVESVFSGCARDATIPRTSSKHKTTMRGICRHDCTTVVAASRPRPSMPPPRRQECCLPGATSKPASRTTLRACEGAGLEPEPHTRCEQEEQPHEPVRSGGPERVVGVRADAATAGPERAGWGGALAGPSRHALACSRQRARGAHRCVDAYAPSRSRPRHRPRLATLAGPPPATARPRSGTGRRGATSPWRRAGRRPRRAGGGRRASTP